MYKLPKMNYKYDALEPFIDARTMEIHHTKHHQTYVDNLNAALAELEKIAPSFAKKPLEELLTFEVQDKLRDFLMNANVDYKLANQIVNNGGGHFNHSLFWRILKPATEGENLPSKDFLQIIEKYFYSFENFQATFKQEALARFGSGWVWLRVNSDGELIINSTPNQESFSFENDTPILALDLWEHAYYLNYQNRRADYVDAFWHVVDWNAVEENYHAALEKAKTGEVREGDFEEGKCDLAGCEKAEDSSQKRVIFTDGSASPNPGPGGFALIENGAPIALGAENPSTNIRMEGLALKKALEILGEEEAEIQTDSEFWVNVLTKWAPDWQKNGWKKKNGEIKNLDIVQPLFELYQKSNATLKWLKGHAGHEWNELADEWANRAREGEKL